jgi:hypothetical protein
MKKRLIGILGVAVFTLSMVSASANVEKENRPGPICVYVEGEW